MSAKITVIVPNYNKEQYIGECIKSVKDQTMADFNCIVVDDGSTDSSINVIQKHIQLDDRFQLFCNTNHGIAFSRNFAIKHADTELILPLDSDDYLEQSYLERIVKHFESSPDTTVFYGRWFFVGCNADQMNSHLGNLQYVDYRTLLRGNSIHCSCAFKRKDAIQCGLYDESLSGFEDWEFLIRLLYKDKKVIYDPRISLYYRQCQDARSTKSNKNFLAIQQIIVSKNVDIYREYL